MKTEHPITPSIELVKQWSDHWHRADDNDFDHALFISIRAARWGADQELDACCEWIYKLMDRGLEWSMDLRASRRPKPPSLKEQALEAVNALEDFKGVDIIRRALESLPDD
jgi:hypothetical protein